MEPEERRYHHGDLRSALLERAESTVRTVGIDALSLRELAREIGVSHAAPRRHFRDKGALLDALAISGFARLDAALRQAVATAPETFPDRLSGMAVAYVRFATENPALLDLMFTGKHQAGASAALKTAGESCFASMLAVVAAGQESGDLVPGDLDTMATVMFATLQGLASLIANDMISSAELESVTQTAVRIMLEGIGPRRP